MHAEALDHAQQAVQGQGVQIINFGMPGHGSAQAAISLHPPLGQRSEERRLRGRDLLLTTLEDSWEAFSEAPRVHVLHGLGGIGKSRVALEFAYRMQERDVEVWWLTAADKVQFSAGMQALAYRVGVPAHDLSRADIADLLWSRLTTRESPWLLIVDNADDLAMLKLAGRRVAEGTGWIRPLRGVAGMVLVTSRDGRRSTWGAWVRLHAIAPLDADDAAQVLIDYAGVEAGTRSEALALAAQLGFLPLGLRLVGSYLARIRAIPAVFASQSTETPPPRSFKDYLDALVVGHAEMASIASSEGLSEEESQEIIRWPWEHSLDYIETNGTSYARALLRLLSTMEDAPIPYELVLFPSVMKDLPAFTGITGVQIWQSLTELANFGLLDLDISSDPATLSLHPLVRVTGRQGDRVEYDKYQIVLAQLLANLPSHFADKGPEDPATWRLWQSMMPHIWSLFHALPVEPGPSTTAIRSLAEVAHLAARVANAQGLYRQAENQHRVILRSREKILGVGHPDTLETRRNLAVAIALQGRYAETEHEFRAIFAKQSEVQGAEHPDTLTTGHAIAVAVAGQRRHSEAEDLFRTVREIRERVLGAEHPDTLTSRHALAVTVAGQRRYSEAEQEYRAVLEIQARVLGAEHPFTLRTWHEVARMLGGQRRHNEAEEQFRQVLESRERVLGSEHPDTLTTVHAIALTAARQHRYHQSYDQFQKVLEARERVLGVEHPNTLSVRCDIARLTYRQGRYVEAEEKYKAVFEMQNRVLGSEHFDTLTTRYEIAMTIELQERYAEAAEELQAILDMQERILGVEHFDTLITRSGVGRVMSKRGRRVESEEEFRAVLEIQERFLGIEHPDTLNTRCNVARVLESQGRYAEAEEELRAALDAQEGVLDTEHPDTLTTRCDIARVMSKLRRYDESEEEFRAVLEIQERFLGIEHPDTLDTRCNMAKVLELRKRYSEAEGEFRAVLDVQGRVLSDDHPDTLATRWDIARVVIKQGRYAEAQEEYAEVLEIETRMLGSEHPLVRKLRKLFAAAVLTSEDPPMVS
ncbi:tetratricopeptide repeat protein [Nonomuraea sp. NPDC003707]